MDALDMVGHLLELVIAVKVVRIAFLEDEQISCIKEVRLGQNRRVYMPRATVVLTPEKRELTSIEVADGEEKAWVQLRRMSYGEKLQKDAEAMKMRFGVSDASTKGMDAEIAMVNEAATLREFARCIVDHNLDDGGNPEATPPVPPRKLNFQNVLDVKSLDPRVGEEISTLIGEMNDFKGRTEEQSVDSKGKSSPA